MALIFPTVNFVARDYIGDTNGLPAVSTFTGATSGTYTNAIGNIATASSGVLRHDYDSSGNYLGWLIEESRTNYCPYSDFPNGTWTLDGATYTADSVVAPDGTTTAATCTYSSGNGRIYQGGITVSVGTHTLSCWLKSNGADYAGVNFTLSGGVTVGGSVLLKYSDGTVTNISGSNVSVQAYQDGWYRVSATVTGTAGDTTATIFVTPSMNSSGTAAVAGSSYIWRAQLEAGAFQTSAIQTTSSSSVTRAADVLTLATSTNVNGQDWFNPIEGTLLVCGRCSPVATCPTGVNEVMASLSDGTSNNHITLWREGGTANVMAYVANSGPVQAMLTLGTVGANGQFAAAVAYKTNDFAGVLNGGTVQTDSSGSIPTVTTLNIGHFGILQWQLNGCIHHIASFPRRLSNADLKAITTI